MTNEIRLVQFFELETAKWWDNTEGEFKSGKTRRYQNYFVRQTITFGGEEYEFAPFQVQGSVSSLNGDNFQIQVLFPAIEYAIRLVEEGNGNRKSSLSLYTRTVPEGSTGTVSDVGPIEHYIGLGAGFSADTIELRFNTAVDSVASNFPAQRLSEENVGILPLDSALSLR
jgi:hypothetical protein